MQQRIRHAESAASDLDDVVVEFVDVACGHREMLGEQGADHADRLDEAVGDLGAPRVRDQAGDDAVPGLPAGRGC